jgi:hypothetical protein
VALLSLVGLAVEVHLLQTFRRRWAGDVEAHPTADLPAPLRRPIQLVLAFGSWIGAMAWKAHGLGESWPAAVLLAGGCAAFVLAIGLAVQGLDSRLRS